MYHQDKLKGYGKVLTKEDRDALPNSVFCGPEGTRSFPVTDEGHWMAANTFLPNSKYSQIQKRKIKECLDKKKKQHGWGLYNMERGESLINHQLPPNLHRQGKGISDIHERIEGGYAWANVPITKNQLSQYSIAYGIAYPADSKAAENDLINWALPGNTPYISNNLPYYENRLATRYDSENIMRDDMNMYEPSQNVM